MIGSPFLRTFPFFIQTILSGKQNVTGAFLPRLNSQIPAKAGTTIHALAGFRFGEMRGFQNGLKPELRTQKIC